MERRWTLIDWKAIKELMHQKYKFNSIEHDAMIIACLEWETSYFTQYPEIETHSDGRPKSLELQGLENDLQFYIEMGPNTDFWGDALLTMEKIDQFCQKLM